MAHQHDSRITAAANVTGELLESGRISKSAAGKIYTALGIEHAERAQPVSAENRDDFLSWAAGGFAATFAALGAALSGMFVSKQNLRNGDPQADRTPQRGRSEAEGVRPMVSGIDTLLSFETLAATLKPLFNEYIWWFIAMLLVISGSIMGIREAWLRFEGILRPLTILFAFFTYHTLFLGLGIFLYKRSEATGRMLLILSALLIPVMFSIANSVVRVNAEAGAAATAISLILSFITLYPIALRVGAPYLSALFYLPIPFAITALAALALQLPWLNLVLIPALAISILAATGIIDDEKGMQKFFFALVGVVVLFFTLTLFTIDPGDELARTLRVIAVMAVLSQFAVFLGKLDAARARFFTALEVVLYAIIAMIPLIAAKSFGGNTNVLMNFSYSIFTYAVAIAVFIVAARRHNAAMHPVLFLSMALFYHVSRLFTTEAAWQIFAFFAFPLVIPWFSRGFHENKKKLFLYWATVAGLLGSLAEWVSSPPHIAAATMGLLTTITIHRAAGFKRSAFHYLSPIGLMVCVGKLPLLQGVVLQSFEIFFVLAIIYAVGGFIFEKRAPAATETDGHPIDDLSLICGVLSLLALNGFRLPADDSFSVQLQDRVLFLRPLLWFVPVYLFLQLRSLRDRSALVALAANLGAVLFLFNWLRPRDFAEAALAFLALAAVFYFGTYFFSNDRKPADKFGRVFLMRLKLPFNAGGINNIGRAAGITTLFLLTLMFFTAPNWIGSPDFDRRSLMLLAQIGLLVMTFLIFHFRVFSSFALRGSLVLLFVILFTIAFTAIINRLGRPLPVDAVGLRLLLLFPVLALVTAFIKVYGPRYGKYLEAEKQGQWYYTVPVTGVVGLTLLLSYDAAWVSSLDFDRTFGFVPPTILLALALYPLILAHTITIHFRHLTYFFIPLFLAAFAGERSFLGPALSLQNAAGAWLPTSFAGNPYDLLTNFSLSLTGDYTYLAFRQNIVLGSAAGVLVLSIMAVMSRRVESIGFVTQALFSKNSGGVSTESGIWSLVFTGFIALMSFQVAAILPGVILMVVALLYLVAGNIRASAFILFLAGLLVVHGGAHLGSIYPIWPGPVLVGAAILMIWPAKTLAAKLDLAESFVAETGFLAGALYIVAAYFYAATEGRPANALQAGISVLAANTNYLMVGGFYRAFALPATFFLTAVFFWVALARITGRARVALALLAHFAVAWALTTSTWLMLSLAGYTIDFFLAAPFVIVVVLLFEIIVTARLSGQKERDPDVYAGNFSARDVMIVFCGLLFIPISQNPINPVPNSGYATLAGLLLYLVVNIQAAFASSKTRYVYIAEATIAGIYYSLRPILGINSAQIDAFFAFGYAFALLGLSIASERFGATVVSEPTRRFAAAMPLVVGLLVDNFRSFSAALYALISSGLYLALSRLGERNIFAALAAITLNAALFFVALAQGFDSSEFYAFPIGLTIIFFASIFKGSLSVDNQARVRTIGGLIAYVPAAVHVTMRSGLAQNPVYSLVFGLVCLAGIIAGGIFRIRSYLFLGVLFFTLNIVANLVQEGLANQFIGFVLLTVTGLLLIAILITYNLKKDAIHAGLSALRQKFARWD